MLVRTLTGALFIAVLIGAILIGEYTAAILFLLIIALGQHEFYSIAKKNNINTQSSLGILIGVVIYFLICGVILDSFSFKVLAGIFPLVFLVFITELFRKKKNPFTSIAYTLLGIFYIAIPFSLIFGMGFFHHYRFTDTYNPDLLIGILLLIWSHDTAAYLFGKFLGKNKLFERISPRKTWEGSIGGAVMTVAVSYFVNEQLFHMDFLDTIIIALIIIFFGSVGDLIESMFKRSANMKDSGKLLPGHGGILDRFDSLLIAAPFIYFYLQLINEF